MKLFKRFIMLISVLSLGFSIAAIGKTEQRQFVYKNITKKQYVKWKKTAKYFIYPNTIVCPSLKNAKLMYNDLMINNIRSVRSRLDDFQCKVRIDISAVTVSKVFSKGRIILATLDKSEGYCSESKCSATYAIGQEYVFSLNVHSVKELKGIVIEN